MPTQTQLCDYFKKKRGRPKGPAAPRKKKNKPAAKKAAQPKPPPAKQAPAKTTRTNWGSGENLKRMRAAVEGWDNNSEQKREAEGDIKRYAALVEIPLDTFKKYVCADKSKRRKLGASAGKLSLVDEQTAQTIVDTVRFPAKLVDMVRKHPDVLRWNQSERTLIIEDRTRLSKITTGMKWSSFRRQLGRYGFYKHDWRTGVPGIVFANCDPRVVTIDDLAGLVRIPPQKMRETIREQLRRVRENDELRKLQDENDELRDENDKLRARVEAAQVALFGFDESEDMPPSGPLGL
tara:strand:+ start:409 stop:1284 length:876 start_codon:yes stop_codon:yes gene_type:complete